MFDGADQDGGGLGFVNPFDAISAAVTPPSSSSANDAIDAIIATKSYQGSLAATSVHEVGHTILGPGHPTSGTGAMRSGVGPAKTSTYGVWIGRVDLKRAVPVIP